MLKRTLVISDLHLADGHPILDGFGREQQAAFDGLLSATEPGSSLGDSDCVELIINGDCFDLLTVQPYPGDGISTPAIAREKLTTIIAHHGAFFEALKRFLRVPGRFVTFIAGNHDIELVFPQAQETICRAICGEGRAPKIDFSETRFYRPLPDVYIEHGHHFDFWNYAQDAWDEQGQPLSPRPERLTLPVGTQYFQRVSSPVSLRYPYFDHFDPGVGSIRQIALLCLLDPPIVIETAQRAMTMLSYPRVALEGLDPGEELIPVKFFQRAILDFAAFQQNMLDRQTGWQAVDAFLRAHENGQQDLQAENIKEYIALLAALEQPPVEAVRAILERAVDPANHKVTLGMQQILRSDPSLRYAIAGHTHHLYCDGVPGSTQHAQVYLNTASWTRHTTIPSGEEVTPALVEWLRTPDEAASPLRDTTSYVFALIETEAGRPSAARLCAWEDGTTGNYRILAEGKE